ncbi:MAG: STAS domain-containing protein [candidate division KSB1 bacterium]|nr:STAS domain-containing protein [candidate division KSB1 bacterium]
MEGIQLTVEKKGPRADIAVIKVGGYIDTTTSSELENSLKGLISAGNYNIIIDLSDVDYISSAGWGIFISEIKNLREKGGDLKLVGMIPDVYEVFELLEFHYILKAFDTIEEAVRDFGKEVPTAGFSEEGLQASLRVHHREVKSKGESEESGEQVSEALEEKIRTIVREKPDASLWAIRKELNTPRFGNVKVGLLALRRLLKRMDLDTREKRLEYFSKSTSTPR